MSGSYRKRRLTKYNTQKTKVDDSDYRDGTIWAFGRYNKHMKNQLTYKLTGLTTVSLGMGADITDTFKLDAVVWQQKSFSAGLTL